ncbi:MAG: hypothetical protein IPK76_15415 [Lewinellaceae bacterium]|nr:hypothetical protein [Lewinellaceae bacterium]
MYPFLRSPFSVYALALGFCLAFSTTPSLAQQVFVSSRNTHSVKLYDFATGNFLKDIVTPGSGGLSLPQEVLLHPDGFLLVTGRGNTAIKKYNSVTGDYLGNFTSGYALDNPTKTTIWQDSLLYVSQWGVSQNKVVRFDLKTGVFVDEFTNTGVPNGCGHAWDAAGNLLVAQYGNGANGRVMKFDTNGVLTGIFIPSGVLKGPVNLWFGNTGELIVADWSLGRVLRFNGTTGAYIGPLVTGLANVEGYAFDNQGRLYLCDWTDNKVFRYDFNANTLSTYIQDGGLMAPNSIVIQEAVVATTEAVSEIVSLQVTPNPAHDMVRCTITTKESITGRLYLVDTAGQTVRVVAEQNWAPGEHTLNTSIAGLPRGLYRCVLASGKGQWSVAFAVVAE